MGENGSQCKSALNKNSFSTARLTSNLLKQDTNVMQKHCECSHLMIKFGLACGIWVVFPDPVSPMTIVIAFSLIDARMSSANEFMGRSLLIEFQLLLSPRAFSISSDGPYASLAILQR